MIGLIIILATVATAWILFRVFFPSPGDFKESLRYWFTPDIVSIFCGEWSDDQWASMKLFLYVALSVGSGILTGVSLNKWFG
jgi:hypothetical protein